MRVITVLSGTWYGRGTMPTNQENRESIQLALQALQDVAPDLPAFGFSDEDYGWKVECTPEMEAALLEKYPESLVEENGGVVRVYLHNPEAGKFQDEFQPTGHQKNIMVSITDLYQCWATAMGGDPVDRTFDAFYQNWFENYGRF